MPSLFLDRAARSTTPSVCSNWSRRSGTDGEQVRSGQADNLIHVAEARAHHLSLVAEFLVVVVNAGHGCDAGVLVGWNFRAAVLLLVPVVDTADEWRDQSHSRFGARNRLGEAEEQSQVAVDAFFLQPLGGADALPGAGDLDQNALTADAFRLVQRDEFTGLGDGALGIEAQARGDFGGYAAGNHLQNLAPEQAQRAGR